MKLSLNLHLAWLKKHPLEKNFLGTWDKNLYSVCLEDLYEQTCFAIFENDKWICHSLLPVVILFPIEQWRSVYSFCFVIHVFSRSFFLCTVRYAQPLEAELWYQPKITKWDTRRGLNCVSLTFKTFSKRWTLKRRIGHKSWVVQKQYFNKNLLLRSPQKNPHS